MLQKTLARLALPALLFAGTAAHAQYDHNRNGNFYNGVRQGSSGGHYDQHGNDGYRNNGGYRGNDGYRNNNGYQQPGGIGPGKGALIGGAGGAALGALLGGGLKGSIVGGAAGAGIGAVVGKQHQNNVRRNDGYYPR